MSIITEILVWMSSFITAAITQFGYLGILVTMILESAAFPIPSEIIMPFAGFVVFQGKLDFISVVVVGTIGNLIGSLLLYYVGLKGGRPFLIKYGRYMLVSEKEVKRAEEWFKKFGGKVIFFSRMLPVARTFISLPAGTARMDLKKFSLYTFIGSVPWNCALVYLGFVLGEKWAEIEWFFRALDIVVVLGIVALLSYFLAYLYYKKKKSRR